MGTPASAASPAPKPSSLLVKEIWSERRDVVKVLLADVMLFFLVLGALLLGFLGLQALKVAGYPVERIVLFERIHYWAYLAAFSLFLLDLLVELFRALFLKRRHKGANG